MSKNIHVQSIDGDVTVENTISYSKMTQCGCGELQNMYTYSMSCDGFSIGKGIDRQH